MLVKGPLVFHVFPCIEIPIITKRWLFYLDKGNALVIKWDLYVETPQSFIASSINSLATGRCGWNVKCAAAASNVLIFFKYIFITDISSAFPLKLSSDDRTSLLTSVSVIFAQYGNCQEHTDGLVQERCNSIAKALELCLFCSKTSILSCLCHHWESYDDLHIEIDLHPHRKSSIKLETDFPSLNSNRKNFWAFTELMMNLSWFC